jgi:hypothetical protein
MNLVAMAEGEVRALHLFFVAWMREVSAEHVDFSTCEMAFAADFRMVGPDGTVRERTEVLDWLRNARCSLPPDFFIEITGARSIWRGNRSILVEYVEQQRS